MDFDTQLVDKKPKLIAVIETFSYNIITFQFAHSKQYQYGLKSLSGK